MKANILSNKPQSRIAFQRPFVSTAQIYSNADNVSTLKRLKALNWMDLIRQQLRRWRRRCTAERKNKKRAAVGFFQSACGHSLHRDIGQQLEEDWNDTAQGTFNTSRQASP
jgi:DNA-binding transcriptional regulator YbjK